MVGRTIGKYRIVGQLGRGGMGTVYKAIDETLDREVAIKVLNPELADTDIMKRFRTEATTLAKLNHPEIATIYELFRSETDLLMVMEFVRGETLDKLSERLGPMAPDRAAFLIDKVLSALEHAHRAGIVHRDMKPANVMVTDIGGVKIMDFGIARVRGAEHMTVDGYMMGTPAYMPPEQVLGQEVDGRADLYSVGVVFYRLLTAALPFKADTAIGMVQKQISDAPLPLNSHREGLPDWCEFVLHRALAKSPADRYQTAEEFRTALGEATGHGVLSLEHTRAFSSADIEATTPPQSMTKLGLTPTGMAMAGAGAASSSPVPSRSPVATSMPGMPGTPSTSTPGGPPTPAAETATPAASKSMDGATIVLRRQHFAVAGSLLAVVALGIAVLAYVALRGPVAAPPQQAVPTAPPATPVSTAAVEPPAAADATGTTTPPGTTPAPGTTTSAAAPGTTPPAAAPVTTTAAPGTTTPAATPASTVARGTGTSTPPTTTAGVPSASTAARGATGPTGSTAATAAAAIDPAAARGVNAAGAKPGAAVPVPARTFTQPLTFDVKALVGTGNKTNERDAQLVLSETKVTLTDNNHEVLGSASYDSVVSISYSTGRDPMWNSPQGPAPVARVGGGFMGIRGDRHWVALRTRDAHEPNIILRFNNPVQVKRGLTALEERTSRKAETVTDRKDAK